MSYHNIQGWFDFDLLYLSQVLRVPSGTFVEVGSFLGRSAVYMASVIQMTKKPITFHCVDVFRGSPSWVPKGVLDANNRFEDKFRANLTKCGVDKLINVHVLNSVDAAKLFADGSLDFIFIDADHSYAAVKADIAAWKPKLKPDGVLAGHDIGMKDVKKAVAEAGKYKVFGPNSWVMV